MTHDRIGMGDPGTHFWLTRSVARAMGVNLSEAMAGGRLSPQGYSEMVSRCRVCDQVTACQDWLATQAVPRCEAYSACCIKAALEALQ